VYRDSGPFSIELHRIDRRVDGVSQIRKFKKIKDITPASVAGQFDIPARYFDFTRARPNPASIESPMGAMLCV
jgi:hypothetical protein